MSTLSLPANLSWLAAYPQFIVCKFEPNTEKPGRTEKVPINPATLRPCGAHEPAHWLTCETAYAKANELNNQPLPAGVLGYGVGFVITPEWGIWCLDIDKGLDSNNQWLQAVQELLTSLPGVAWEFSHSGKGLHGWGRSSTVIPAHDTRHTDAVRGLHLELYTRKRFIALGTTANGEASVQPTLPSGLSMLFPALSADDAAADDAAWTYEAVSEWHGPTNDDALLTIALKSRSVRSMLNPAAGNATFKQLWEADADKLAKHYPAPDGYNESQADMALACHLAFYTGNHWERIATLMRRSALGIDRAKYDRPDYMHRTIGKACRWQKTFYNDGKGITPGAPIPAASASGSGIGLDDFYAYLPQTSYIFVPNRELWVASGVDSSIPWPTDRIKPSEWLAKARPVHQMTWAPGEDMVILNRLVAGGGWISKDGANTFNLYKPPTINPGDPSKAGHWLELIRYVYPDNAEHIIKWFAHRRQRPGVKINHALVLGGPPRIGKDSICEPLKRAVGPWNFKEIAPRDLLAEFNPWLKSVVLRVSEARDSGDMSRFALYEHSKTLLASPPDVHSCNEKNLRQHDVFNVIGVIFTTNHKDGLYLPADDGRHYVAWSEREREDFQDGYWAGMYHWYETEGFAHVAAYLDSLDLSTFNPKEPPDKTAAFWAMVDAGRSPEEGDLADTLDKLGNPPATAMTRIESAASPDFRQWLRDVRNRKQIRHRFETLGYTPVRNGGDKHDGQWRVDGKRQTVYVRKELIEGDRQAKAAELSRSAPPQGAAYGVVGA